MTKGVMYLVWGNYNKDELERSRESVREKLNLPVEVIDLGKEHSAANYYVHKKQIFDLAPFRHTLFLDTDTVVLDGDLELGWVSSSFYGFSMAKDPIENAARHNPRLRPFTEWNTGVIFFDREDNRVKKLSQAWKDAEHVGAFRNDQACFCWAVERSLIHPYYLPKNYNFMGMENLGLTTGPIKIWHAHTKVPNHVKEWNRAQKESGEVFIGEYSRTGIKRKS